VASRLSSASRWAGVRLQDVLGPSWNVPSESLTVRWPVDYNRPEDGAVQDPTNVGAHTGHPITIHGLQHRQVGQQGVRQEVVGEAEDRIVRAKLSNAATDESADGPGVGR